MCHTKATITDGLAVNLNKKDQEMEKAIMVAAVSASLMATAAFADNVSSKAGKQVAAVTAAFVALEKAFVESDAGGVASLCTPDAVMMAPDSADVVGSAEILKYHQHLFETLAMNLAIKTAGIQ
jgi:hypothetical protein